VMLKCINALCARSELFCITNKKYTIKSNKSSLKIR
jgi:hypothetical protein